MSSHNLTKYIFADLVLINQDKDFNNNNIIITKFKTDLKDLITNYELLYSTEEKYFEADKKEVNDAIEKANDMINKYINIINKIKENYNIFSEYNFTSEADAEIKEKAMTYINLAKNLKIEQEQLIKTLTKFINMFQFHNAENMNKKLNIHNEVIKQQQEQKIIEMLDIRKDKKYTKLKEVLNIAEKIAEIAKIHIKLKKINKSEISAIIKIDNLNTGKDIIKLLLTDIADKVKKIISVNKSDELNAKADELNKKADELILAIDLSDDNIKITDELVKENEENNLKKLYKDVIEYMEKKEQAEADKAAEEKAADVASAEANTADTGAQPPGASGASGASEAPPPPEAQEKAAKEAEEKAAAEAAEPGASAAATSPGEAEAAATSPGEAEANTADTTPAPQQTLVEEANAITTEESKLFSTNNYEFQEIIDSYKNTKANNEAILIYNYIRSIKKKANDVSHIIKIKNIIKDKNIKQLIDDILEQKQKISNIDDYL